MTRYTGGLANAGEVSPSIFIDENSSLRYSLLCSNWQGGSVVLEKKTGSIGWKPVDAIYKGTDRPLADAGNLGSGIYRLRCLSDNNDFDISFVLSALVKASDHQKKTLIIPACSGKIGGYAGWIIDSSVDNFIAICPSEADGASIVVPINGLQVGDIITKFYATGRVDAGDSAGESSIYIQLKRTKVNSANSINDEALEGLGSNGETPFVGSSVIGPENTSSSDLELVVQENELYYFVVVGYNTADLTNIFLQSLTLDIIRK